MSYDKKLEELYLELPQPSADAGNSVSTLTIGKFLHVGGVLPFSDGKIQFPGRVGVEVRLDNAKLAARLAGVMMLALVKRELAGSLSRIKRLIKIDGYVACGADFRDHVKVIDGAGELFVQIFGVQGKHIRTAVGVSSLPQGACVELSAVFEIK